MSLWEDYEADAMFDRDFPYGVASDTWNSASGEIKLCDMSVGHIQNCMRLVGEDDNWYPAFQKELDRRHYSDCPFCGSGNNDFHLLNSETMDYSGIEVAVSSFGVLRMRCNGQAEFLRINYCPVCGRMFT